MDIFIFGSRPSKDVAVVIGRGLTAVINIMRLWLQIVSLRKSTTTCKDKD